MIGPVSAGWRMLIRRWTSATCADGLGSGETFSGPVTSGVWEDTAGGRAEPACFSVQLVNRYDAGQTVVARLMTF